MDTAAASAFPSITAQALRAVLGTPRAPLVLDVRKPQAFGADRRLIPAALRRTHDAVDDWAPALGRDRPVVAYCAHGREVSEAVVRRLGALGADARTLAGGFDAWIAAGAPTIDAGAVAGVPGPGPTRWVTRERPKIDRIACPWLVRRFIDPLAEFVYVAPDRVLAAAQSLGATAYDVPGVRFSHRGERCSFDAFLADFGLLDPALASLATIVRGADTARPELSPQSPGLLALSLGLSALYSDDREMLEHGIDMYDALYAWLRSARGEAHNANLFRQ